MQEKNEEKDNLSYRLREAIRKSGKKQKDIASCINVTEVTLSRYCSGSIYPRRKKLNELAEILNVSEQWLLCGEEAAESAGAITDEKNNFDWKSRALAAEERLERIEKILNELFAFARIGKN